MVARICEAGAISSEFSSFLDGTVLPLAGMAAMITAIIIGLSLMLGRLINNPKATLWAKTEAVQLVISLSTVVLLGSLINTFCAIDVVELMGLFEIEPPASVEDVSIYDAAETYLVEAAYYSHNAMSVARFHLEGYTVLSYTSVFSCGALRCFFGYSGTRGQPFGAFGAGMGAMNLFFNSMLMAHISCLSFLFLLVYVYRGFVFLFLPLGIFIRSMPYMRGFGSLLMAVSICFLLIYPLILSLFYMTGDVLLDRPVYAPGESDDDAGDFLYEYRNMERKFYERGSTRYQEGSSSGTGWALLASLQLMLPRGEEWFQESYFPDGGQPVRVMRFCASAFIAAVFLPTLALIGTIASIVYMTRMLGEEIDLSKITRMI